MKRLAAFLTALSALTVLLAGSVGARETVWYYEDKPDSPGAFVDVRDTSLDTKLPGVFRVRVRGYEFLKGQTHILRLYFDTDRANSGPEFSYYISLSKYPGTSGPRAVLSRVDTWEQGGTGLGCRNARWAVNYDTDIITVKMPRACLGNAKKIRWAGWVGHVKRTDGKSVYGRFDDFPSRAAFSGVIAG